MAGNKCSEEKVTEIVAILIVVREFSSEEVTFEEKP